MSRSQEQQPVSKPLSEVAKEARFAAESGRILYRIAFAPADWPEVCIATLIQRGQDATTFTDAEFQALESTLDLPGAITAAK